MRDSTSLKNPANISQESNSNMKSIDELSEIEIEKLSRAIIHQALQESKLCSIPVQNTVEKSESYNNSKIIVRKNVVTHWIH